MLSKHESDLRNEARTDIRYSNKKVKMLLQPKHRWFSSSSAQAEEWSGPFPTIDKAIAGYVEAERSMLAEDDPVCLIFVSQGRRTSKEEREEGEEHPWIIVRKFNPIIIQFRFPNGE